MPIRYNMNKYRDSTAAAAALQFGQWEWSTVVVVRPQDIKTLVIRLAASSSPPPPLLVHCSNAIRPTLNCAPPFRAKTSLVSLCSFVRVNINSSNRLVAFPVNFAL